MAFAPTQSMTGARPMGALANFRPQQQRSPTAVYGTNPDAPISSVSTASAALA